MLRGTPRGDVICGLGGNDVIVGLDGDGTGRDLADGESGTDSCTVDPGDTVRRCRAT